MNENSSSKDPMVNGESITGLLDCLRDNLGGDRFIEKLISELPPESADVCKKKIIAVGFYPYSVFVDCIRAADRIAGKGDLQRCRDFGRFRATSEIGPFLKTIDSKENLQDLLKIGPSLWKTSRINSGYMEVVETAPGEALLRIHDFPGMDPAHCIYMEGYFSQAMLEVGATWIEDVHETKCASTGEDYHEFAGTWR